MENLDIFRLFCSTSVLIPLAVYLKAGRRLSSTFGILAIYLGVSAAVEAYGAYTIFAGHESNNEVYNFYTVAETIFYAFYFGTSLRNKNAWWTVVGSCYVFNFLAFIICVYNPIAFARLPWSGSCVLVGMYAMQGFSEEMIQITPDPVRVRMLISLIVYYFVSGIIYAAHPVPDWCHVLTLVLSAANNLVLAWAFHQKTCIPETEHRFLASFNPK